MNLRQLREQYFQVFGERVIGTGVSSASFANTNSANRQINQAIHKVISEEDYSFLRTEGHVRAQASESTGTVTATEGDTSITGAGTAWNRTMEGQLIIVNGFHHRIRSVSSTTALVMDQPYLIAGNILLSYTVHFDSYKFPRDLLKVYHMRQLNTPSELLNANTHLEVQHFLLFDNQTGVSNRVDMDFNSTMSDFYTAGTATTTTGSPTVTGIGTSFATQNLENLATFRFADQDRKYQIQAVVDGLTLTLTENFRGTGQTGQNYVIDPAGIRRFRVLDYTDFDRYIILEYKRGIPLLVDDTDTPAPIPEEFHESVILKRAIYEALVQRRLPSADIKRDYDEAVRGMVKGANLNITRFGARIRRIGEGRTRLVGFVNTRVIPT